ncbi:MAG: hypothetical protein Hyperionvirus15_42 [Hyperionvirus sp.]|uniref:Glycosyl transferase family 25 domain-containing protein n=1 Tax=Hyperionvirus sp. TaxID=2487770 RepID=A0A3G5ABP7_9VIRU|nr:MAG: hypothetical protein Hyperionvirus15_42 [Hyperionvirus sp.]
MDFLKGGDIWCICLEDNKERYASSLEEFKKIGLKSVKYFRPKRDVRGGRIGCWTSHVECMKKSYESEKKAPYVVIFEDDIKFVDDWRGGAKAIGEFLVEEPKWDIVRLGGLVSSFHEESMSSGLIWKGKCYNNHALIVSLDFIKNILGEWLTTHPEESHLQIDGYYRSLKDVNDYILVENICYQKNDLGSDNKWFKNGLYQNVVQNKYCYEFFQRMSNRVAFGLRCLPVRVQECANIIPCLFTLGNLFMKN